MTRMRKAHSQAGKSASGDARIHPSALAMRHGSDQEALASHHVTCPTHPIYKGGQAETQRG